MLATPALDAPLKWHGGKGYLAAPIIALMPPHLHYVEAYAGGLSVLLRKEPHGVSEVCNDRNGWLTNFWSVLRDPEQFEQMRQVLEATPFSEPIFIDAKAAVEKSPLPPLGIAPSHAAALFFVCCRQSMSGRMKSFAPLSRNRVRRAMNEQASAWLTAIEGLPAVHERLRRVVVLNGDACRAIEQQDGEKTLYYCDPPYLHETRTSTDTYGEFEMTPADHERLLTTLAGVKGRFILSGYDCELYRTFEARHGWHRRIWDLPNNAASGDSKRRMIEVVWMNYEPAGAA